MNKNQMPWKQNIHVDRRELQGPSRGWIIGVGIALATLACAALGVWALVALGGG